MEKIWHDFAPKYCLLDILLAVNDIFVLFMVQRLANVGNEPGAVRGPLPCATTNGDSILISKMVISTDEKIHYKLLWMEQCQCPSS